ncbi:MAG: hypothetical protein DI613_09825 [Kocuria rhizophila]|nr:MAG: hypothetical protein DI613_09825 [Kocuria rhizophila]
MNTIISIDEEYPAFQVLDQHEPGTVEVTASRDQVQRWKTVINDYASVKAEIAAKISAITGDSFPGIEAPMGYFEKRARKALTDHGMDPNHHTAVTAWAEEAHGGDRHRGIIVDAAGQALAHTHLVHHLERSVWAVLTDTCDVALGCRNSIAESLDAIKAATGKDVAHIRYSDVCEGQAG